MCFGVFVITRHPIGTLRSKPMRSVDSNPENRVPSKFIQGRLFEPLPIQFEPLPPVEKRVEAEWRTQEELNHTLEEQ